MDISNLRNYNNLRLTLSETKSGNVIGHFSTEALGESLTLSLNGLRDMMPLWYNENYLKKSTTGRQNYLPLTIRIDNDDVWTALEQAEQKMLEIIQKEKTFKKRETQFKSNLYVAENGKKYFSFRLYTHPTFKAPHLQVMVDDTVEAVSPEVLKTSAYSACIRVCPDYVWKYGRGCGIVWCVQAGIVKERREEGGSEVGSDIVRDEKTSLLDMFS